MEKRKSYCPQWKVSLLKVLEKIPKYPFKEKHQYIPKSAAYHWSNHNYLTFTINKDSKSEYILMGMDDNAKYGFDKYDAHKLFGTSEDMPEIYFKADDQELAVNVFPTYPASFDIGYYVGKQSPLSITIGNLSILPEGIILFMEDKYENKFYNLCSKSQIDFNAIKGTTEDRFRVHILKSLEAYTTNIKLSDVYMWSDSSKIMICDANLNIHKTKSIRVWDKKRNMIAQSNYKDEVLELPQSFLKESYLVDILIDDVWIENIPIEVK